uniref:Uncharacterized protein n=1 Tax=Glossina brevipalpis TaxID=37001 RepID=A0A1A9W0K8_9MUSC
MLNQQMIFQTKWRQRASPSQLRIIIVVDLRFCLLLVAIHTRIRSFELIYRTVVSHQVIYNSAITESRRTILCPKNPHNLSLINPRIVPIQLLKCLKVLLDDNGGILSAGEVKRIASLMTKYSKKLVSKCIYVQILKCTKTELLGEFMGAGGWSLVYTWLNDAIRAMNWPLVQEILELLLLCPVDVHRLKINSAPKLVKGLQLMTNVSIHALIASNPVRKSSDTGFIYNFVLQNNSECKPKKSINQLEFQLKCDPTSRADNVHHHKYSGASA